MKALKPKRPLRHVLLGALLLGLAGAQISLGTMDFLGRRAQSVTVNGAEYARQDTLSRDLKVTTDGRVVRVEGYGHVLLLPLDPDTTRATSPEHTVQLDTRRALGRTATLINGNVYVPLDTLAAGLGATYQPGSFQLPAPRLTGVASRAGRNADRIVLDLTRDVDYTVTQQDGNVQLTLPGTAGSAQTYTTRGQHVSRFQVNRDDRGLSVTAPLPAGAGYRAYRVVRDSGVRIVLDVGPGITAQTPALSARLTRPLIVLDPAVPGSGNPLGDVALEVARETGELLSKAGWQVRLTRTNRTPASIEERSNLARASDVFISLDVANVPGSRARGVTVFEPAGRSNLVLTDTVRNDGQPDRWARLSVGDSAQNRQLSQLLRGELRSQVDTRTRQLPRAHLLGQAPHAAVAVELGWASNDADVERLQDERRRSRLAVALARSVATYLSARASGGS